MASANAIRAGKAFVEISANDASLAAALAKAQARIKAFGQSVQRIGVGVMAFGGGISAGLLGMVKQYSSAGDALDKMSARTGFTVETLSTLDYAANQSGTSLAALESAVRRMQVNVAGGSRVFQEYGLSLDRLRTMNPEEQFLAIADTVDAIPDPARKAAAAVEMLGRSSVELLPLMSGGASGIAKLTDEAKRMNLTMSAADATAAAKLGDAFDRLWRVAANTGRIIGSSLAEPLTRLADRLAYAAAGISLWVRENKALVAGMAVVAVAATVAGAMLAGLGITLSYAAAGIGSVLAVLKVGFLGLTSPITLIGAAIAGVVYLALQQTGMLGGAIDWLNSKFSSVVDYVRPIYQAIRKAFDAGEYGLAARLAWLAIRVEFVRGYVAVAGYLDQGLVYIAGLWDKMVLAAVTAWWKLPDGVRQTMEEIIQTVASVCQYIVSAFQDAANLSIDALGWISRKGNEGLHAVGLMSDEHLSRVIDQIDYLKNAAKSEVVSKISISAQSALDGVRAGSKARQEVDPGTKIAEAEQAKEQADDSRQSAHADYLAELEASLQAEIDARDALVKEIEDTDFLTPDQREKARTIEDMGTDFVRSAPSRFNQENGTFSARAAALMDNAGLSGLTDIARKQLDLTSQQNRILASIRDSAGSGMMA